MATGETFPGLTGVGARRLADGAERIVVVGAGGWLGLATLELLHGLLGDAFKARVACFGSTARTLRLRDGLTVTQQPLAALANLSKTPTLVLHLAFLTQEKAKAMADEDYIAANEAISGRVVDALDVIGAEGVFLPSSGAVYMVERPEAQASMRLYGRLKLEDEARFTQWAEQRGKLLAIARVFNLSGPYINKQSSYALACFIADALEDRPIAIKATRPVFRSFVAISEMMSVVFGVLTEAKPGVTLFDTAGERPYEMTDVAETVIDVLGSGRGVDRRPLGDDPPDNYVGDGAIYKCLRLGFDIGSMDFPRQVAETARYMGGAAEALRQSGGV
jgi:nucleoside-diphosphate-sugar epimerase